MMAIKSRISGSRQIFNEAGVLAYIRKEDLICVGDKFMEPKLEVDAEDNLDMEEGKKRKGVISIYDMKAIIEKEFNEGTINNKETMAKFFYDKGMCIPYTNHETGCCQFLEYLVSMRDMSESDKRMSTLPTDSAMYWFEFISVQKDWLKLFKRFVLLFDRPRNPHLDNQTALVLWGSTGTGKTWATSFVNHNRMAGYCSFRETGVGRFADTISHNIIVVDDPHDHWLRNDRPTVLNLLAGNPFTVKVHSTTRNVRSAKHVIITCNRLPLDNCAELSRRMDLCHIKKYLRHENDTLPLYNISLVCEYLKTHRQSILADEVPCICGIWNSTPCHVRKAEDSPTLCKLEIYTDSE